MNCVRLITSRAKSSCTPCGSMWKRVVRQRWWLWEVKSFSTFVRCPLLLFWLSLAHKWKTAASHRASSQKSVRHTCRHTTQMCVSCGLVSYCFFKLFFCLFKTTCLHPREGRRTSAVKLRSLNARQAELSAERKLRKTSLCWVAFNCILMRPWKNIKSKEYIII